VAVKALESGMDSPSLREVAGLAPIDPREARELFAWASWIIDGTVSPRGGAAIIWRTFMGKEYPEAIAEFILLEEQWERGRHRAKTKREIVKQARRLLTESPDRKS
jgi:hypothetical protein